MCTHHVYSIGPQQMDETLFGHEWWTVDHRLCLYLIYIVLSIDVLCVHLVRREISHVRLCLTVITQWGGVVQWCHAMSRLSSRLAETSQKYLTWKQLTFNIISYSCSVSSPTCNTGTVQQHSEWILTKHINFLHQWPINIYIASLDLPDEGFNINRKVVEKCSSFTPNPFHDVISQVST